MGKPLLTDDMIAEAQKEANWEKHTEVSADRATGQIYKSRRIENTKRGLVRAKLNRLLVIVILLILALIYAMFKL